MSRLVENINYNQNIVCNKCKRDVKYHVTDMKGVGTDSYIICPYCQSKIQLHSCDEQVSH